MAIPDLPIERLSTAASPLTVVSESALQKNFGLSPAQFEALAFGLRHGDEALFEEIFLRNFEECRLYIINKEKAEPADAYDAVMDALLHLRALIQQQKVRYGNLRYLFYLMARQRYGKQQMKAQRYPSLPTGYDLLQETDDLEVREADFRTLERGMAGLGATCRELLKRFYLRGQSLKSIGAEQGRSAEALRQQKSRCLKKLRFHFTNTHK